MRPDARFLKQSKSFWACVRTLSQEIGYTERGTGRILVPSPKTMADALSNLGLDPDILLVEGRLTELGARLLEYFDHRAATLHAEAQPNLMDAKRAAQIFNRLRKELKPTCPLPFNKQKGAKKKPAYLTGLVNMLIEANAKGYSCNYDPRQLTTITRAKSLVRTLARRVDGAFPSPVNPIAVWEIKEYYYTTTFGSRIADGVYETLLDGMELEELREHERVQVKHYLMADAYSTWWEDGKAYLCRIVDMLHMGYVDEVLFGHQVVSELPRIVSEWVEIARQRAGASQSRP